MRMHHHFRLPEQLEESFPRRSSEFPRRVALAVCRVLSPTLRPFNCLEQIGKVRRDQINDFYFQRLFGGDGVAFAHGGLGPFDIAMPFFGDGSASNWPCTFSIFFFIMICRSFRLRRLRPVPPDAPRRCVVCGAIAATSAARVMNTPALPASRRRRRDINHRRHFRRVKCPGRCRPMRNRRRPPGVSSWMMRHSSFCAAATSMAREM